MMKHNRKGSHDGKSVILYMTNTRRHGRTDPIAIGAHYLSPYGVMMVWYGAVMK